MSKGHKPLNGERLKLVTSSEFDYCDDYHCAGDCGLPHNQKERNEYVSHALKTFDMLESAKRRQLVDAQHQIRRRAKDSL